MSRQVTQLSFTDPLYLIPGTSITEKLITDLLKHLCSLQLLRSMLTLSSPYLQTLAVDSTNKELVFSKYLLNSTEALLLTITIVLQCLGKVLEQNSKINDWSVGYSYQIWVQPAVKNTSNAIMVAG